MKEYKIIIVKDEELEETLNTRAAEGWILSRINDRNFPMLKVILERDKVWE